MLFKVPQLDFLGGIPPKFGLVGWSKSWSKLFGLVGRSKYCII